MFHPQIEEELIETRRHLEAEGRILGKEHLASYYDLFRRRFGPEVLRSLDGEALLHAMHNHSNRDSLVYWLEFKDDEEFPGRFGSIAGGTAHKFGIYRRRETGVWVTGSPTRPRDLTLEEAVQHARKHRDQLVRGARVLESFAEQSGDGDYLKLQEDLASVAPDVSDSAWGHKYFSLLFPDKLDEFHVPDHQRFHLIKLLQTPPDHPGRYVAAGRYLAMARKMDLAMNNLTLILGARNGRPHRYWRIGTSDGKKPRNRFQIMLDGSCIAVGWPEVDDLSYVSHDRTLSERIRQALQEAKPEKHPSSIGKSTRQLFNFVATMSEGDMVLACDGGTVIGVARIVGGYYYDPSSDFAHRRPVEWLCLAEWKLPEPEGLQTTVHPIRCDCNMVEAEKHLIDNKKRGAKPDGLEGVPGQIQAILERKGQVILYGPPGTGKTYHAVKTAHELAARHSFGRTFETLGKEEQAVVAGSGEVDGRVRLCCFHPGYGYEDFIEGYRPEIRNGAMTFTLKNGIFKTLCEDASRNSQHRFFLVIDEINRSDTPSVFGELLTVLERDKRGRAVVLPLSRERFTVPPNVYIIGTMNTADRSITLLDTALRRRFGFIELMPDTTVLAGAVLGGIPLGPWLEALNERIREHLGRDGRNLQIGHSYFLEDSRPLRGFQRLARVIREDIIPLLEEYCYEDYATLEKLLGRGLVDVGRQRVRRDLFEKSASREELVQALLAPCPDLSTSLQSVSTEADVLEEEASDDSDED